MRQHFQYQGFDKADIELNIGGYLIDKAIMVALPDRPPFLGLIALPWPQRKVCKFAGGEYLYLTPLSSACLRKHVTSSGSNILHLAPPLMVPECIQNIILQSQPQSRIYVLQSKPKPHDTPRKGGRFIEST